MLSPKWFYVEWVAVIFVLRAMPFSKFAQYPILFLLFSGLGIVEDIPTYCNFSDNHKDNKFRDNKYHHHEIKICLFIYVTFAKIKGNYKLWALCFCNCGVVIIFAGSLRNCNYQSRCHKISHKIFRLVDISAFYICLSGIWQITFDNISEVNTNLDEKWVNRLSIFDCSIFVCIWWYTTQCLLLLKYGTLRISHIGRLNKQ